MKFWMVCIFPYLHPREKIVGQEVTTAEFWQLLVCEEWHGDSLAHKDRWKDRVKNVRRGWRPEAWHRH